MTIDNISTTNPPAKPRRNWWKLGFFVLLFAFELVREWAVLAEAQAARPSMMAMVYGNETFARAQGQWQRIDGGGDLVPTAVTIRCDKAQGTCIEAMTSMNERYVHAPDVTIFDAKFAPEGITYENDFPTCAHYTVRIDLKLKKAFHVRTKKTNVKEPQCANLERRIESQLTDGHDLKENSMEGHFVPLFQLIRLLEK